MGVPKWQIPSEQSTVTPPRKRARLQSTVPSISRRAGSRDLRTLHAMRAGSSNASNSRRGPFLWPPLPALPAGSSNEAATERPSTGDTEVIEFMGTARENEYERELEARQRRPPASSQRQQGEPSTSAMNGTDTRDEEATGDYSTGGPWNDPRFWRETRSVPYTNTFRPYHTTLSRHNAIRNLRRMLQPTSRISGTVTDTPYHNRAWTSSVNLPQIAHGQSSFELSDYERPRREDNGDNSNSNSNDNDNNNNSNSNAGNVSESMRIDRLQRMTDISAHAQAFDRMIEGNLQPFASSALFRSILGEHFRTRVEANSRGQSQNHVASLLSGSDAATSIQEGGNSSSSQRLQAEAVSPRLAWLARKSHSSGLVPNAREEASDEEAEAAEGEGNEQGELNEDGDEEEEETGAEEDENCFRPITRSTSFSSSTSRRSQRTVHFTNPVSDAETAGVGDQDVDEDDDGEMMTFTIRAATPPPPVLMRNTSVPPFMMLPEIIDGLEIDDMEEIDGEDLEEVDAEEDVDADFEF